MAGIRVVMGISFATAVKAFVQAPGSARTELINERLEIETRRFGKQTDRQNTLYEDVVKDRFRIGVGHRTLFQGCNLTGEPAEVILEP